MAFFSEKSSIFASKKAIFYAKSLVFDSSVACVRSGLISGAVPMFCRPSGRSVGNGPVVGDTNIDNRVFLFNTSKCSFSNVSAEREKEVLALLREQTHKAKISHRDLIEINDPYGQQWRIQRDGKLFRKETSNGQWTPYPSAITPLAYLSYGITDKQGNVWLRSGNGLFRLTFSQQHYHEIPQEKPARARAFFLDNRQRYWITTNDDPTIRIYDKDNTLLGYLGRDGHVHSRHVSFGSPIYHIMQDTQGIIWMCSKPDGLFRLKETGNGIFAIEQFRHDSENKTSLGGNELYCMAQDQRGRLWVATFNDGLQCIENPMAKSLSFFNRENGLHQPDNGKPFRVHYIYITKKGVLLGATTGGLLIGDVSSKDLRSIKFRLHKRDSNRSSSLSNNAVIYIMEDSKGRIFVCTESGGLNQIIICLQNGQEQGVESFRQEQLCHFPGFRAWHTPAQHTFHQQGWSVGG